MDNEIKIKINLLAKKINAPEDLLPVYQMNDFAHPYIEIDSNGNYNYVVRERGEEYERKKFNNFQELLFEIFRDTTHSMATKFELNNRVESQDFRIILFSKQEELLAILNKEWAEREHKRHKELLKL